jgi:hypothetical protein
LLVGVIECVAACAGDHVNHALGMGLGAAVEALIQCPLAGNAVRGRDDRCSSGAHNMIADGSCRSKQSIIAGTGRD